MPGPYMQGWGPGREDTMTTCAHEWVQIHEVFLLGGSFPVGYRCRLCNEYVSQHKITPSGLPGRVVNEYRLVGPHGGQGDCADGTRFKMQIRHEDGTLEIRR